MDVAWKVIIWQQFGAAIDMLENSIRACPKELWRDRSRQPEFWYVAFHTLFFLDFYCSEAEQGFVPPLPFTLDELDPAGLLPERVYSQDELLSYLEYGRRKCREAIQRVTKEQFGERCRFTMPDVTVGELLLYNMRHVQHHAAQLNLLLRHATHSAPGWVRKTGDLLDGP